MEPRIQYAQTDDGVSIAYWTLGEGMPFVQVLGPWTPSAPSRSLTGGLLTHLGLEHHGVSD